MDKPVVEVKTPKMPNADVTNACTEKISPVQIKIKKTKEFDDLIFLVRHKAFLSSSEMQKSLNSQPQISATVDECPSATLDGTL